MNKHVMCTLLALLVIGCGEQKELIFRKELTSIGNNNTIYYELYKTGIDNYKYEFKMSTQQDTIDVFDAYLNDATYKNVKFSVEEKRDTLFINSNWSLGYISKSVRNKVIILSKE